jgi:hypothetical protein
MGLQFHCIHSDGAGNINSHVCQGAGLSVGKNSMRKNHFGRGVVVCMGVIAVSGLTASVCSAVATVTASSPYLSTANSTLDPLSPTYVLEDFEDGNLLPAVTFASIAGSGVQSGPFFSVDADDGAIDGNSPGGYFQGATSGGSQNNTFFFSQIAGQWPKQVAIAITGGSSFPLGFTAYDTSLSPNGSMSMNVTASGSTADDLLVTFIDNGGIGAIVIQSNTAPGHMQYDHLQFDTAPVPEPATLSLLALAGGAAMLRRRPLHRR